MEKVWKVIKKVFVWLFKDWKNIAVVALLIGGLIAYCNYRVYKYKYDNAIIEHNDSTTVYKNKIGELYAERETYITDIRNLKKSNSELYAEVQHLKDNPIIITKYKTVTVIKDTTITNNVIVLKDSTFRADFAMKNQWYDVSGFSTINTADLSGSTTFNSLAFYNNFTLDLIEGKKTDKLSFIVKSDNPYCQINSLDGVVLSPEKVKSIKQRYDEKWVVVAGIGPSFTIVDNKFTILPAVQITVGYKLLGF